MKGSAVARERFVQLLEKIGGDVRLAPALGELYLAYLSRRGDTLPGARSALARLGRRFPIAVVTNGYERVQRSRLRAGRLAGYFEAVVTSEACGYAKPHPGIVRVALDALGVEPQEAVYVGDDAHTDGGAAHAAGVPFYWLDRGVPAPAGTRKPRYSISSLGELADSLGC
jgi:HAD superfamily hydrolase (TIGR01509 family)